MVLIAECLSCRHGDHAGHDPHPVKVPEGVMGGQRCPCRGECVERGPDRATKAEIDRNLGAWEGSQEVTQIAGSGWTPTSDGPTIIYAHPEDYVWGDPVNEGHRQNWTRLVPAAAFDAVVAERDREARIILECLKFARDETAGYWGKEQEAVYQRFLSAVSGSSEPRKETT